MSNEMKIMKPLIFKQRAALRLIKSRRTGTSHYSLFIERRRHRRSAAFTLVELLTVIAIMVIVAAISIPAFAVMFAGNNMVQAKNQLSAAVAGARTLAIDNHTEVALIFFEEPGHTAETAYAYEQLSPGQGGQGTGTTQYFQPMPQESVQYLPKGVYVATLVGTADSYGVNNADNGFAMPPQQLPAIIGTGASATITFTQPNNTTWANSSTNQAAPLRAIVFDGNGHLIIVNSMITQEPEQIDQPGLTSPMTWWNGIGTGTPNNDEYFGPSAPGFVLYQPGNWPNPLPGGDSPGAYLAANSDITMISTYTGNVIQ
jgi:prepilin-type N-terminal cleavage/methylation domain-containing protein